MATEGILFIVRFADWEGKLSAFRLGGAKKRTEPNYIAQEALHMYLNMYGHRNLAGGKPCMRQSTLLYS